MINHIYNDRLAQSFRFTDDQVGMAYHSGSCDEGCAVVVSQVQDQFEQISDCKLRDYVREYGLCADEVEKMCRADLLAYSVWFMCGDISENPDDYDDEDSEDPMGVLPMMQPIIDQALDKVMAK